MDGRANFFVGWGTLSLINAGLAQSKGRSGLVWCLLSLLLGPIATLRPGQPFLDLLGNELGPVIATQMLGRVTHGEQLLRVMITSRAVNDLATSRARHSLVNSSITTRIRNCLPSSVRSVRKS